MRNPKEVYNEKLHNYNEEVKKLSKKSSFMSNIRLIIALIGISLLVYIYIKGILSLWIIDFMIFLITFIVLLIIHNKIKVELNRFNILCEINNKSLDRLSDKWRKFKDDGSSYINDNHPYLSDLDIFGNSSVFQYINVTNTYSGRMKLKDFLSNPLKNVSKIINRQNAIEELSNKIEWRQSFQTEGLISSQHKKNPEDLIDWGKKENDLLNNGYLLLISKLSPIVTIFYLLGYFLGFNIHILIPIALIIFQIILLIIPLKESRLDIRKVYNYRKKISTYEKLIELFENEQFESSHLREIKEMICENQSIPISQQIKKLDKIMNMLSIRHSQLYLIINILTLWDYQCSVKLETWKRSYGKNIATWLDVIGELEALSSLSILKFNNPEWVFPEIVEEDNYLNAINMGHPLISKETRVVNDIEVKDDKNTLLITGSNMSGKSTFLRTVGINLVLAYSGAPVCANKFECGVMNIYTSMRVKDSLNESISSFYAELLRIKKIISAVDEGEKIITLIDEVFKGTNSKDRHVGASALIKKLSKNNVMSFISTHDLELGDLENNNEYNVKNYHFNEYYLNDELLFSYELKEGVSTSQNAIYLMRKIGIDINEE